MSDFQGTSLPGEIVLWAVRWYWPVSDQLPRPRSDDDRARRRGRPLHDLSLGAAFRAGDGETSAPAVAPAAVAELARRRDLTSRSAASGRICTGAVDKLGNTIDFYLSATRNTKASESISRQGAVRIERVGAAEVLNTDKAPALCRCHRGAEGRRASAPKDTRHRQVKYLNNVIEADHGKLKLLIRPVRGFKTAEDGLRHDQGLRGDARAAQGPGRGCSPSRAASSARPGSSSAPSISDRAL